MAGGPSARQAIAVEGEAVEGAEDGGGNLFGAEKFLGERLDVFAGDGFDGGEDLVESEEAAEIEFLAREIGHAGKGGFQGKHEGTLEMVLGAQEFLVGNGRFLEGTKFREGEVENLADCFFCAASVDGEHARVGIRSDFAENGVGEAALFANVLEEARRHAAAEKIIENGDDEAAVVCDGQRRNTEAEMNLLEIGFAIDLDGRAGLRRDVIFKSASGLEMAELFCDEVGDLVVCDVAGGGDKKMVGREPFLEAVMKNCG